MASPLSPDLLPSSTPVFAKPPALAGAPSRLAWNLSRRFLPWQDDEERKFYALQYKCLPPPLFIPLLTLLQLCLFTYYAVREGNISAVVPLDSPLIFRTDRREEVWRFLLYCLLHAGWWHVAFNAFVQCIVGLPLEIQRERRTTTFAFVLANDSCLQSGVVTPLSINQDGLAGAPSRLAWNLSRRFLPWQDDEERKFYALQYKCLPPPLFIPLLTLLQLCLFTYYAVREGNISAVVPLDSPLIFRTDRREEVWRFLLYCLLHAGWWHVAFNAFVQCIVGLPLEMLHGSPRITAVYAAGVLAGSLGTSVFDSGVYLVGGSGGCYALLAAHVAHVLINYAEMDCGLLYIIGAICIGSVDVGYAIWNRYVVTSPTDHPVSYIAHLAGAAAGLSLGVVLLRKFGRGRKEPGCTVAVVLLTWLALGAAAFLYNLTVA